MSFSSLPFRSLFLYQLSRAGQSVSRALSRGVCPSREKWPTVSWKRSRESAKRAEPLDPPDGEGIFVAFSRSNSHPAFHARFAIHRAGLLSAVLKASHVQSTENCSRLALMIKLESTRETGARSSPRSHESLPGYKGGFFFLTGEKRK